MRERWLEREPFRFEGNVVWLGVLFLSLSPSSSPRSLPDQIERKIKDPMRGERRVDVRRSRTRLHSPQRQGLPAMIDRSPPMSGSRLVNRFSRIWDGRADWFLFRSSSSLCHKLFVLFLLSLCVVWVMDGSLFWWHAYKLHEMQIGVMMRGRDCMRSHTYRSFFSLGISPALLSFPLQLLASYGGKVAIIISFFALFLGFDACLSELLTLSMF